MYLIIGTGHVRYLRIGTGYVCSLRIDAGYVLHVKTATDIAIFISVRWFNWPSLQLRGNIV